MLLLPGSLIVMVFVSDVTNRVSRGNQHLWELNYASKSYD